MNRRWRRATLRSIKWFPETFVGRCYRGGLITYERMNQWTLTREYVVHSRPDGRLGVEYEWSMK